MALAPNPNDFIVWHNEPSKSAMDTAARIFPDKHWHDLYPTARIIDEMLNDLDRCDSEMDQPSCEDCDLAYTEDEYDSKDSCSNCKHTFEWHDSVLKERL